MSAEALKQQNDQLTYVVGFLVLVVLWLVYKLYYAPPSAVSSSDKIGYALAILEQNTDDTVSQVLEYHKAHNTDKVIIDTAATYYTGLKAVFKGLDLKVLEIKQKLIKQSQDLQLTQVQSMCKTIIDPNVASLAKTAVALSMNSILSDAGIKATDDVTAITNMVNQFIDIGISIAKKSCNNIKAQADIPIVAANMLDMAEKHYKRVKNNAILSTYPTLMSMATY